MWQVETKAPDFKGIQAVKRVEWVSLGNGQVFKYSQLAYLDMATGLTYHFYFDGKDGASYSNAAIAGALRPVANVMAPGQIGVAHYRDIEALDFMGQFMQLTGIGLHFWLRKIMGINAEAKAFMAAAGNFEPCHPMQPVYEQQFLSVLDALK